LREWTPLAKRENAEAQSNFVVMSDNGRGVPKDFKIAVKWYRLAVEKPLVSASLWADHRAMSTLQMNLPFHATAILKGLELIMPVPHSISG
jgi:TPR repeat protein